LFFIVLINLVATAAIFQGGQAVGGSPAQVYIPMVSAGGAQPTQAPAFPTEADFVQTVVNHNASQVTGVYVRDVLALNVVQQPEKNYTYISTGTNAATQYSLASQGVVGLLAHNTIAGKKFFNLKLGQKVSLIFGDGNMKRYAIKTVVQYQAINPSSYSSDFIDLKTGEQLSGAEVFALVYLGGEHITFQTCITKDGNASWGRLFVIAEPY
jgi:hypothetical protein